MDTKNQLVKVKGLIIKEADYKEFDKLLTLLTGEYGKISVYAFGVRKENSKSIGKIRRFSFSNFELRKINDRYQFEDAKVIKSFDELASNYEDVCFASYFIELADYFVFENEEIENVLKLLFFAFKALLDKKMDRSLIKRVFELKMLKYQGIYTDTSMLKYKNLSYTWDFVLKTDPKDLFSFTLSEELRKMFFDTVDFEMKEKVNKKFKSLSDIFYEK